MEQVSEIHRFLINCICEKYIKMAFFCGYVKIKQE